MKGLGSGESGEFTFLDNLAMVSFFVGLMNLRENLTQGDKQDIMDDLSNKADQMLKEIHGHLEAQDAKLTQILEVLNNA